MMVIYRLSYRDAKSMLWLLLTEIYHENKFSYDEHWDPRIDMMPSAYSVYHEYRYHHTPYIEWTES